MWQQCIVRYQYLSNLLHNQYDPVVAINKVYQLVHTIKYFSYANGFNLRGVKKPLWAFCLD